MNVLIGIPCLLTGGTEIQTLSLVNALTKAGHRVCVACYFEHTSQMASRYQDAGAQVVLLSPDSTRPIGVGATIKHLWLGLRRIVKTFRPDVAHVQYMAPGALPVIILRMLGIKRIVATTHTPADIYSQNGLKTIRFLCDHVLTAFQCITELAEQSYFGSSQMFSPSAPLSRHFTIYNNIPAHISVLTAPRTQPAADSPITIGVVSRLEHLKGMDLVIPAFAEALQSTPHIRLLVVGDGSQRSLMEQQAATLKVTDHVQFVGRQPQGKLQEYYDNIDILLMPSRSEGFGLTAIEGMARGCVPIVARVGGLPEVVTPHCGLLHAPDNIGDLAEKIATLAADRLRISALSSAAIIRANVFSTSQYNKSIHLLYDKLADV